MPLKFLIFSTARYIRLLITCLALCFVALPSSASAEDIGPFYIKHLSSGLYVHPEGGSARTGITAVLFAGVAPDGQSEFIFRRVEGNWGLIIHRRSKLNLITYGGGNDASNNTRIVFYKDDKVPGAHFIINQDKEWIQHKSTRYWHPRGGSSRPSNNTGIVVHDETSSATQFVAVNIQTDKKLASFVQKRAVVAGRAVGDWVAVRTGGTAKGKVSMSKSFNIGGSKEEIVSAEVRNSISVTVESGVSFGAGSAGLSVTGSHESAKSEAIAIAKTFNNGGDISCEQEIDTETYDYNVMWQWQVTVTGNSPATIATCTIGCTSTGVKPAFLPGSAQQLESCKVKRRT